MVLGGREFTLRAHLRNWWRDGPHSADAFISLFMG
jgi:hypothetical protein